MIIIGFKYFCFIGVAEEPLTSITEVPDSTAEDTSDIEETASPCSPGFIVGKNGTTLELLGQDLWKKFHKLGTEMIITKAGR